MADASQPRTRRDQLRLQQQQDARRQRTRMRVIYAVAAVVLLAIIATVTIVVVQQRRSGGLTPDQRAAQISPPNLNAAGTGIVQNPRTTGDVPTVTVYLDFQCPYCKAFNETYAPVLNQLAGAGEIKLEVTVLTVIGQALGNEDASERAGRAAFCADVVGVFPTYQDAVFAGQPEREGEGFTDEQLRVTFANQAGLQDADLARFQQCYDQKATAVALASEQTKAMPGFDHSTPQVSINGTNPMIERDGKQVPWWTGLEATTDAWQKAIAEHS
ncbi:DsbA family protein [Aestuariimicrobium soli]|uniref:DsbA family protein n=1 Tax=Aestuariimicrobium soli TaxID=2035834 RepID=UPI003EBC9837